MIIDDIAKISSLPSPALGLLPAVHDATVVPVSSLPGDPASDLAGEVFENAGSEAITLPAWGRWPAQQVASGGYFASDGRLFFPVVRRLRPQTGETSWYPMIFERVLYTIHMTPKQFTLGSTYAMRLQCDFRLVANTSNAVWSVFFEVGQRTSQTDPAPIGPNLEDYVWREPLLEQQVVLTDVACRHTLGVLLENTTDGYTGSRLLYDKAEAASPESLPVASDFALRDRLGCFDTQNSVADPKGFAAYVIKEIGKE